MVEMVEEDESQPKMSRRRFGAITLGGAGAVVAGGVTMFLLVDSDADGGSALRSFDVIHDPSVYVTMTNGLEFTVEVKDTETKEVLERFDRVTARSLLSLDLASFSESEVSRLLLPAMRRRKVPLLPSRMPAQGFSLAR
jgi:hypothetical protein